MSGPKGYAVSIESAAERRRRQTREVLARCNVLNDKLEGLRAVIDGEVVACEASGDRELEGLLAWETRLAQAVKNAERLLAEKQVRTRMAAMASTVGLNSLRSVSLGLVRSQNANPSAETEAPQDQVERLTQLLARASEIDDQALVNSLAERAKVLLGLAGPVLTRGWLELESEIAQAVKRHRVARRCRDEAEAAVLRIAHLDGQGVEAIRASVTSVVDQPGLARLRTEVARAIADAEREADAAFVTEQARLVLAELGYVVDEPFEVVDYAGEIFVAHHSELPDHALQVHVNSATNTMLTSIVAAEGTSATADAAAEAATCADVLSLTAALARRGVHAEPVFHRKPGEVPVQHSLESATKRTMASTKKKQQASLKAIELKP